MTRSVPQLAWSRRCRGWAVSASLLAALAGPLWARPGAPTEPAVTVLADFEDDSVAATISTVENVLASDCGTHRHNIPARGQGCLGVDIGATARGVTVVADLIFREPTRFDRAARVAVYCWITAGEFELAFRVRDAKDQLFETQPQRVEQHNRWARLSADLAPAQLRRLRGDSPLTLPLEIAGVRLTTPRLGQQTVLLDDLQIEHPVMPRDLIHGEFELDEPTHIYAPGATIKAAVVLENQSRQQELVIAVELAWKRPDGSVFAQQHSSVRLPNSGADFRSYRRLDFSQCITEPGLYQLVAQARAPGWAAANTFETTVAVTPSNRRLARGRSTFFGVHSNLFREPQRDQLTEVDVARDIGVNLLALDLPWRRLEPKPDTFEFAWLDPILRAVTERDMAPMVVLTQPPDWLPRDPAGREQRVARVLRTLIDHYGGHLVRFHLAAEVLSSQGLTDQLAATQRVREFLNIKDRDSGFELLPPPIPATAIADAQAIGRLVAADPELPLAFATSGALAESLAQLEAFRQQGGFRWRPAHRWLHQAEPLVGAGHYVDAEAVLRHYVRAAAAGVGGLIWFDLRDDDNDPGRPLGLRGFVRRDFSPKTSLLGYAASAGQLTGYRCAGPVAECDACFDSGLFIGADRQVAVLLPRANQILPAVLAPQFDVRGRLSAQDFERRALPVLTSVAGDLIVSIPRPVFITLELKEPQPEPQLRMTTPWIRVPQVVFVGQEFTVEIDVPFTLERSYMRIQLPKDSRYTSTVSATALRGEAEDTIRIPVTITTVHSQELSPDQAILRVSLEGRDLDIPLQVQPLKPVHPLLRGTDLSDPRYQLGLLTPRSGQRATATAWLHATHTPRDLRVLIRVADDRFVPLEEASTDTWGDALLIGVARIGTDAHVVLRLDPAADPPALDVLHARGTGAASGWPLRARQLPDNAGRAFELTIPAASFGGAPFALRDYLRLAVRYFDDDADGFPAVPLSWGAGLDGARAPTDYPWIELYPE